MLPVSAVIMVRYFHGEDGNEGIIGRQTGLLVRPKLHHCRLQQLVLPGVQSEAASGLLQVATASAAQAISAFCWGLMSDRIGRKVSNLFHALSCLCCGGLP